VIDLQPGMMIASRDVSEPSYSPRYTLPAGSLTWGGNPASGQWWGPFTVVGVWPYAPNEPFAIFAAHASYQGTGFAWDYANLRPHVRLPKVPGTELWYTGKNQVVVLTAPDVSRVATAPPAPTGKRVIPKHPHKCPACGSAALLLFQTIECTNFACKNWRL
jgi:hypothetical protein